MTTLADLTHGLSSLMRADTRALADIVVSSVTIDSRKVKAGSVFVACPGAVSTSRDGHDYLDVAVRNGAVALVVSDGARAMAHAGPLPVFVVPDPRRAAAVMAERVHGSPSRALTVIGITGTNGKTTTTWLLAQLFAKAGRKAAVLGTLGAGPLEDVRPLGFTTPEAEVLSAELARLRADGVEVVAMEVSSHALATARVDGLTFAAAGFTNLTRDHLDFHGSMPAYFEAKARLFSDLSNLSTVPGARVPAVLPAGDDEDGWQARLRELRPEAMTWGARGALDVVELQASATGMRGVLVHGDRRAAFTTPLLGGYNVENLLVAAGCALACGLTLEQIAAALADATAPPGRLQRVDAGDGAASSAHPLVVVDYAHSPDALERALLVMRPLTAGKLIVVFGCGGDRDAGKRPIMGRIASQVADVVIVTDDNPRGEDGDVIAEAILAGALSVGGKRRVEPALLARTPLDDTTSATGAVSKIRARRMAIRAAIACAQPEDAVLIAGKGHERTQSEGSMVVPFDDVVEATRALRGEPAPALLRAELVMQALAPRGVELVGALPAVLSGVSTDSRRIEPGSLFVPLVGEHFDGHSFLARALGALAQGGGATAALVARSARVAGAGPLLVVDDTLRALQDLARAHLACLPATRIALTGSNGKTTTKDLLAACLRAAFGAPWVLATQGNLNNHIGVPLTALLCEPEHRALVFEMGMNHLGEIALLADIVRPHVGLITNMGTAHAGNVGGVEGVALAKSELYQALLADGVAVVNADDARCLQQAQRVAKCRHLSFGKATWADVRIVSTGDRGSGGQDLELSYGSQTIETSIPFEGRHNAGNAAGAVAAAIAAGAPFSLAARGLAAAHHAHGRLQRSLLPGDICLLDDTYNANPDSMEAALEVVRDLAGGRRRVVVLGEMRELGDFAADAHHHIGAAAALAQVNGLFCCGALGRLYGEGAVAAGLSASAVVWAEDNTALAARVVDAVRAGDIVLVKGSRGARMEVVVAALVDAHTKGGKS